MAPPPDRAPDEAWTIFGRWRRRSPGTRRLGVALLVLALLLTLIWARTPRPPLDDTARGEAPSISGAAAARVATAGIAATANTSAAPGAAGVAAPPAPAHAPAQGA